MKHPRKTTNKNCAVASQKYEARYVVYHRFKWQSLIANKNHTFKRNVMPLSESGIYDAYVIDIRATGILAQKFLKYFSNAIAKYFILL